LNCINNQKGVTVKDIPAKEFIQEYAKFLKKGNKIRIPEVSLLIPTMQWHKRLAQDSAFFMMCLVLPID
jgi:ribosomal protein S19E (S16A)